MSQNDDVEPRVIAGPIRLDALAEERTMCTVNASDLTPGRDAVVIRAGMEWRDGLVNATTACRTWGELVDRLSGGYVPTVYGDTRRKVILRRLIRAAGYRVWPAVV